MHEASGSSPAVPGCRAVYPATTRGPCTIKEESAAAIITLVDNDQDPRGMASLGAGSRSFVNLKILMTAVVRSVISPVVVLTGNDWDCAVDAR